MTDAEDQGGEGNLKESLGGRRKFLEAFWPWLFPGPSFA